MWNNHKKQRDEVSMIFLGAGASELFGIKTMQGLTDDLIAKMQDKGYGETVDQIIRSLRRFNLVPDFESVYTALEALTSPEQAVEKSGSFTAYIANTCKGFEEIKAHAEFHEVLSSFRELIYDSCTIKPPELVEKNGQILDRFFKVCLDDSENRQLSSLIGHWSGGGPTSNQSVDVGRTIVTTNYDMAIELYHRLLSRPLADGFQPTNDPFIKEFAPTYYSQHSDERWLIKLHGSIWQFRQKDRIIKTIEDPKKSSLNIRIDEQMMIYPVGEKPILEEPYYFFYELFKEQVWQRLIAIGYSFRDEPVNIAILENLRRNRTATLIVINPQAENVIQNLGSRASAFNDRIIPIPEKFGDTKMLEKLGLALNARNRSKYQDMERRAEELKEASTKY